MNQRLLRLIRLTFIILDLAFLNLVFFLGKLWYQEHIIEGSELQYAYFLFFLNFAWLASGWSWSVYQGHNISTFESFCRKTARAWLAFLAMAMLYLYVSKGMEISRVFVIMFFVSFTVGIMLVRLIHLVLFQIFRNRNYVDRKIIILGYNDVAKKLVSHLESEPIQTQIVGFCESPANIRELSNYPIIGEVDNAMALSRDHQVTEIYSTISPEENKKIYSFMKEADQACIRFRLIPDLYSFVRVPIHVDYLGGMPLLSVRREPLDDIANRLKKRAYDLVFSILVIVFLLSWMIPLVGLLIKLESRGPVFFIQKRSGRNNKSFSCIKFRSMRINKDADLRQATKDDFRVTKLGRLLRRTNLDEFPQFINVLMGHMSVVGPRPHMLKHTDDYSKLLNQYMVRQFAKPGITGWAQVKGFRGETRYLEEMQGRVEHDLWYLENWSLWLDTRIIFLTLLNTLKGEKAAY